MYPHEILDLCRLIRSQWLSPAELQRLQERRLLKLVRHAYEHVPYYRRLFDSVGLKPSDVNGLSDLEKIPISSKADLLRPPLGDIMVEGVAPERCRVTTTSGATGVPFKTYMRRKDSTVKNLGWVRTYLAHGTRPWDRIAVFTGWQPDAKHPWYERMGIWRRKMLSSLDTPDQWIGLLRQWKPHVITGYSMTLNILASALQKEPSAGIKPRLVFHSSGILDDRDRELIGNTLRSSVVDIYGSHEAGCVAWECPQSCRGYHINVDLVVLEIVKDGRQVPRGEEGEIVVTCLHSHAMPLIRYRQGDIGSLSPDEPSCGRGMPLLRSIHGRIDDYIVLPSGHRLSPHPFHCAILLVPGIRQWRIIQEEKDLLKVEVVAGEGFGSAGPSLIEANLRKIVRDEMRIVTSLVENIERDPRQKFRSVISRVRSPHVAE